MLPPPLPPSGFSSLVEIRVVPVVSAHGKFASGACSRLRERGAKRRVALLPDRRNTVAVNFVCTKRNVRISTPAVAVGGAVAIGATTKLLNRPLALVVIFVSGRLAVIRNGLNTVFFIPNDRAPLPVVVIIPTGLIAIGVISKRAITDVRRRMRFPRSARKVGTGFRIKLIDSKIKTRNHKSNHTSSYVAE